MLTRITFNGNHIDVDFPMSAEEIPFDRYLKAKELSQSAIDNAHKEQYAQALNYQIKALETLVPDAPWRQLPAVGKLEFDSAFGTFSQLEQAIYTIISVYEPIVAHKRYEYTHLGQKFVVLANDVKKKFEAREDLTIQEYVECSLLWERSQQAAKRANPFESRYIADIGICALLLRKPGERIPADPTVYDKWLEDRLALFGGAKGNALPMSVVLDVEGFFLRVIESLEVTQSLKSILKAAQNKTYQSYQPTKEHITSTSEQ